MRVIVSSWLITLGLLGGASPLAGQAAAKDTAAMAGRDSVPPAGDSAPVTRPAPAPASPSAPADQVLRTACGPLEAPSFAPDLLVIVFGPEVDGPGRAGVARAVRGNLAGPTGSGEADSYYLKVPADGNYYLLQAIGDRLIGRPEVRQVGSTVCPPPPPAAPAPLPAKEEKSK